MASVTLQNNSKSIESDPIDQKAGCKKIFSDKMTGSRMDRPGWHHLMEYVRPGDALVVTELSPQ